MKGGHTYKQTVCFINIDFVKNWDYQRLALTIALLKFELIKPMSIKSSSYDAWN